MTIKKICTLLLGTLLMFILVTGTAQPEAEAIVAFMPQVDGGWYHTIALKADGTVWTWGRNWKGNLGDGTLIDRQVPGQVPGLNEVISISAGRHFCVALKMDGTLWTWGENNYGQLGDGTTVNKATPTCVLSEVAFAKAGWNHVLAVKTDGTLWAWGCNAQGQVGDGTTTSQLSPI